MAIKTVNANIVEMLKKKEINMILHQCNCMGLYNKGLAKDIRNEFPYAYESYHNLIKGYPAKELFKKVNIVEVEEDKFICNAFGQFHPGRLPKSLQDNTDNLRACLFWTRMFLEDKLINNKDFIIGIPYKISCGIEGGNWKDFESMINEVFEDYQKSIIICRLTEELEL